MLDSHPLRGCKAMEKIGKYEIVGKIGSGGFAVVYKARDPFIKRSVAIKVCHSSDENTRLRFYREAEIAGQLVHRNITTVYDFGLHGEMPFLVEEYLSGEDLAHAIRRREPSGLDAKLDCLLQIASGLGHAHARGVMHRDVKPSNVRLLENGRVKIMDFGTAKMADVESHLTQAGITLGTVAYLAPERLQGQHGDLNSDIFSFGVLAYELLSFRRPFAGHNIPALIDQVLNANPVPLTESWPDCPPLLAEIVHKCLTKSPRDRYQSCDEVIADLECFRDEATAATRAAAPPPPREASEVVSTAVLDALTIQIEGFLERSRHLLDQGKVQRAEILLQEVLELDPDNAEAAELLARCRSPKSRPEPAPPEARWESPEEKRERKVSEATASIERYLEAGELVRAAAALEFARQLLGDFPRAEPLGRGMIALLRREIAAVRSESHRSAERLLGAAAEVLGEAAGAIESAEVYAAWIEDLDPGNPELDSLYAAIESAKRRRRASGEIDEEHAKRAQAVASIERYLDTGDLETARRALDFAHQLFGDFEEARDLEARIRRATGS